MFIKKVLYEVTKKKKLVFSCNFCENLKKECLYLLNSLLISSVTTITFVHTFPCFRYTCVVGFLLPSEFHVTSVERTYNFCFIMK